MDLGLLFFEEADELVVLLDGFEGLDVDGLAGGAGAVDDAGDAALELAADGDDEAVAADGDEVFLRGAFAGELAQGGAEGFFDGALLALLLAADAAEFGRGVVGEGAVGLDFALDGFGERLRVKMPASAAESSERPGSFPARRAGGRLEQGLPGGDVVGEAGDGLELGGFEGCAGDLRFGGELGGIEEAAEGDGDLFGEKEAEFGGELMLASDPVLVGGGAEVEDGWRPTGEAAKPATRASSGSHSRAARVGVFDGGRDGIEQGHGQ